MATAAWSRRSPMSIAVEVSEPHETAMIGDRSGLEVPLFEKNPQAMCVVDKKTFCIVEANHATAAMFGYRCKELAGLSLFELSDSAEHDRLLLLSDGVVSGRAYSGAWHLRRKDGGSLRVRAAWNLDFGRGAMLWTFEDQTQLEAARAAAREAGELLATLFADSPQAICRYGLGARRVAEANRTMLEICGIASADERRIYEPLALEQCVVQGSSSDAFFRALNGTEMFEQEVPWQGYDGVVRTVKVRGYAMRSDAEERLLQIEDVTAERATAQANEQREKMEALGRVAATVAHDFNNILLVMRGYAEMLQRALPVSSVEGRHAAALLAAADSAAETTAALVGYSRKEEELPEPLDLNDVAREMADRFFPTLPERINGRLALSHEDVRVVARHSEMQRMLLNLAANARDAMPGGGQLTVATSVRRNSATGRIERCVEVSDTGTGMDAATKAHIFERFFTTKAAGRGTGLGLAFVESCMTQVGGRVEVESSLGKGSSFRLVFAVEAPHGNSGFETPKSDGVKGATILLVDDDEHIRCLVAQFLTMLHHNVVIAAGADGRFENFEWRRP